MAGWMGHLRTQGESAGGMEKSKATAKGWGETLTRSIPIVATFLLLLFIGVSAAQDTFAPTGSMGTIRGAEEKFTLTRLANGKVLAVGGENASGVSDKAEVYDPATGTWSATASMAAIRSLHTATLLQNGKVLVAGGYHDGIYLASAELYDPATGTWSATGSLSTTRAIHTATLLGNGKVLVAAGHNGSQMASAELYDPATGTWSPTSPMAVSRYQHRAVLLGDGRVLIAGGTGGAGNSVEIYNPATGTWSAAANMPTGRWQDYTLTLLANGKVLAAGGVINWTEIATAQAEIYDPATGNWTTTAPMPTTRNAHSATLLGDGRVLVAAGNDHPLDFVAGTNLNTAIIYDPTTASWSPTANTLGGVRRDHHAVGLLDGRVLVVGGSNDSGAIATAELYGTPPQPDLQIRGKITWNRDTVIRTMNADASGQASTGVSGGNPDWSPDGTKIVYTAGAAGIYVINADGSNSTELPTPSASNDDYPAWSPDGTKIAWENGGSGTQDIWVMDAVGGTNKVNVSNNSSSHDWDPDWSPDGTKLSFTSDRDGNREIYVMNADGSGQTRLTTNAALDYNATWSPDGTKIAFYSTRDGNDEIYVMNADGSSQTRLTNNSSGDFIPSWSPDGTKIIFQALRDGNAEIYVMNADGSGQTNVTNSAAGDVQPSWDIPFRIGTVAMGTSVARVITIDNKGTGTLNVSNITSSDGQFSVVPTNFAVAPGDSQYVTVTFTPTSAGVKYSTLTITSNDATSPTAKLTVNGTGNGIATSVPDTVASYNQLVSVPVRVGDTSGEGVVAGEVHLVFNGDVLTVFSVGTSSTLLSGWTVQSNVVQGVATPMDTLKIATAHTTALSGAGTLFNVRFQVADLRHPVTSPLVLSHLLFNTGSVGTSVSNGSLKLVGSNGSLSSVPPVTIPRHAIGVTVSEVDENRNPGVAEVRSVRVSNGSQTETLNVTETGLSTGVFTGSIGTVFSLAGSSGDGVVQAKAGDEIVFAFDDSLDAAGNTVVRRDTTQVVGGKDGRVRVTVVSQPGDTVRVRLTDGDLNTNPGLAENTTLTGVNVRTGESEVLTLTEKSVNDSIFFGTVKTSLGSTAGSNNDGVFKAQKGDTLRVIYADTLTLQGGYATVIDRDKVVNPFGDADGNGSVQAFDAARVLFHVLAPFIVGIDSLSANVDLLAPFGPISPYDASLILQKRVGLIGRFPVQEDESDNHPQPETDSSTPKPVVAQRVLSLAQGEGYWAVLADDRSGILSGEVVLGGIEGRVALGPDLQEYLLASRGGEGGMRVVFAGAVPASGPGELLRVYPGVGPGSAQLTRAVLNDGQLGVVLSGVASETKLPTSFALLGNYPNPFNPETTIGFALPERSAVVLEVYDVLGQRVRVLVGRELPAGQHQVVWDGRDELGRQVGSGVYMYHLQAGAFSQLKRMVMVK